MFIQIFQYLRAVRDLISSGASSATFILFGLIGFFVTIGPWRTKDGILSLASPPLLFALDYFSLANVASSWSISDFTWNNRLRGSSHLKVVEEDYWSKNDPKVATSVFCRSGVGSILVSIFVFRANSLRKFFSGLGHVSYHFGHHRHQTTKSWRYRTPT